MQRFISKYALAAHLAILAVAPLFLSPVCVFWLAAGSAIWMLMEPSCIGNEWTHDARRRVIRGILHDPLFWFLVVVVAYAAVRFANGGVAMNYDAEHQVWSLNKPEMPILPGSVAGRGSGEFAVSLVLVVVLMGLRHALGRSARAAFALVSSAAAGLGCAILVWMMANGDATAKSLTTCSLQTPFFFGAAAGAYLLMGTVALVSCYERRWLLAMPLTFLAIGGNAVGLFLFAPPLVEAGFLAVEGLILLYSFVYARGHLSGSGEFKLLVTFSVGLGLAGLVVMTFVSPALVSSRISAYVTGLFIPEGYASLRDTLSAIAFKTWKTTPWLGAGLGSFPFVLRFGATNADWLVVQPGQAAPLNGYWYLLVERGILGAGMIACVLGPLVWTYLRRLVKGLRRELPHPMCLLGPLAVALLAAETVVDDSFSIPGVMLAAAAILSLSARAFPKERKHG